jgi:hypothetical protein
MRWEGEDHRDMISSLRHELPNVKGKIFLSEVRMDLQLKDKIALVTGASWSSPPKSEIRSEGHRALAHAQYGRDSVGGWRDYELYLVIGYNVDNLIFDPRPPMLCMGGRGTLARRAREEREGHFSINDEISRFSQNTP